MSRFKWSHRTTLLKSARYADINENLHPNGNGPGFQPTRFQGAVKQAWRDNKESERTSSRQKTISLPKFKFMDND